MTVAEASERLQISKEAVRKRISRGSLRADKDPDGTVRVYVPASPTGDRGELVEELRDRVRRLEHDLDVRSEEIRRKDHIIAGLVNRIPELEPAARTGADQEPPDPPETAAAEREREDTGPATAGSQTSAQRPWWRRVFGG